MAITLPDRSCGLIVFALKRELAPREALLCIAGCLAREARPSRRRNSKGPYREARHPPCTGASQATAMSCNINPLVNPAPG
jgi:hypothetical protein